MNTKTVDPDAEAIAWAKKLEKLLKNYPKGYWLFCTGGLTMLKCDEDGSRKYNSRGSVDIDNIVYSFSHDIISMDGGDW